jgi:hypothetical protein
MLLLLLQQMVGGEQFTHLCSACAATERSSTVYGVAGVGSNLAGS